MTERPILFSGAMVRALLAGTKTQTRRVVDMRRIEYIGGRGEEDDPGSWGFAFEDIFDGTNRWAVLERGRDERHEHGRWSVPCPYGSPGDRLWVRETWAAHWMYDDVNAAGARSRHPDDNLWFAADPEGTHGTHGCPSEGRRGRWRPSIHMPRWASRILLEVTAVRVQRLQDLSEEDAREEGVASQWVVSMTDIQALARGLEGREPGTYRNGFQWLWDSINGDRAPWSSNPWCWCISFRRLP